MGDYFFFILHITSDKGLSLVLRCYRTEDGHVWQSSYCWDGLTAVSGSSIVIRARFVSPDGLCDESQTCYYRHFSVILSSGSWTSIAVLARVVSTNELRHSYEGSRIVGTGESQDCCSRFSVCLSIVRTTTPTIVGITSRRDIAKDIYNSRGPTSKTISGATRDARASHQTRWQE